MTSPKRSKKYIRWFIFILGGLLVLCIAVLAVSALINRGLPTQSEPVDRLSELDKARLAELLHLKKSLGDQVWPGFGRADIPIILYNEAYAFLVGYQEQPLKRMAGDDGDGRFYYSGMAQGVLLDRLMPGWKTLAMQEGVFLEALLADAVGN